MFRANVSLFLIAHVGDFTLKPPLGKGHLSLPDTRTSTRHGRAESVTLEDEEIVAWAARLCKGKLPGEKLNPESTAALRKLFAAAVETLGWKELDL